MKEIKKSIVSEVTIYELTKEELEEIKKNERLKGRDDIRQYVNFAWHNFYLELNYKGKVEFFIETCNFLLNGENNIHNVYKMPFDKFIETYRNA